MTQSKDRPASAEGVASIEADVSTRPNVAGTAPGQNAPPFQLSPNLPAPSNRLPDMRISAVGALVYYLLLIVIFAVAHCIFGTLTSSGGEMVGLADALYFSVVTATTLGYGDVLPNAGLGRTLAGAEVLLGVVIAGIFLNSLWLTYTDRVDAARRDETDAVAKRREARRLATYLRYFDTVYERWTVAQRIVTNLPDEGLVSNEPRSDWTFADLQWIFAPSLLIVNATSKSAVEAYYDALTALNQELRFILAQFDLFDHRELFESIVEMLAVSDQLDARSALESYPKVKLDEPEREGGGRTLAQLVVEMIKLETGEPDTAKYGANLLTPVILLHQALRAQSVMAAAIRVGLHEVADANTK